MSRRRVYVHEDRGMTITAAGVLITASIVLYVIIHFWWVFVMIGCLVLGVWAVVKAAQAIQQGRLDAERSRRSALERVYNENRAYNNDPYGYVEDIQDTQWNRYNT